MIPQDMIDNWLSALFGRSDPGDTLHQLLIATGSPADASPFGVPNPERLHTSLYVIDATGEAMAAEELIQRTIAMAMGEARQAGTVVYLAGLNMEIISVPNDIPESKLALVQELQAKGRLNEHPDAVEASRLYAACRDGRRWLGEHTLTGPRAGQIIGPVQLVGALHRQELGMHQRLIRTAVQ